MKAASFSRFIAAFAAVVACALPATASACSVCMGDPSTKTAGAMNGAIFLMLGFVALMLGSIVAFAIHLTRRANASLPPQAEIASMMTDQDDSK